MREGKAYASCDGRQALFGFLAIGQIKGRLGKRFVQDPLQAYADIHGFEGVNVLLKAFGDGKVARLYPEPVVAFSCYLGLEQQVNYFLIDKLVVALEIVLIDIYLC